MLLTRLILGIQKAAGRPGAAAASKLLSTDEFRLLLERERARSDRNGDRFSVLVFGADRRIRRDAMPHLAEVLARRLRITDQAGWLDGGQIGVFLPSTPPEGAQVVASDVRAMFPKDRVPPNHRVYCYPSDGLDRPDAPVSNDVVEPSPAPEPVIAQQSLFVRRTPLWKRTSDVVVATASLVLLSPLFLLIALAIKWTSPGPILFRQRRSGLGGRPFTLYKFRSMVVDADARKNALQTLNEQDGPAFKIADDPRVTAVGRLLRKTSLDELPQLWNVLRGEMSVVGPRPLPCEEMAQCEQWHFRRLDVTPGLTCLWQTSDRTSISFDEWMRMDVRYMKSRSVWADARLILATVLVVVRGNRW